MSHVKVKFIFHSTVRKGGSDCLNVNAVMVTNNASPPWVYEIIEYR